MSILEKFEQIKFYTKVFDRKILQNMILTLYDYDNNATVKYLTKSILNHPVIYFACVEKCTSSKKLSNKGISVINLYYIRRWECDILCVFGFFM